MCSTVLKFRAIVVASFLFTFNGILVAALTPEDTKIIDGSNCLTMEEFGYMVSLRRTVSKKHFCAGVIINEKYILTAAHCLQFDSYKVKEPKQIKVVAGELYSNTTWNFTDVSRIIIHEDYKPNGGMTSDIAIIELKTGLDLNNPNISKCELNNKVIEDERCIITGWGPIKIGTMTLSDILQRLEIFPITNEYCQTKYEQIRKNDIVVESMVCAENDNNNTITKGDSGGPLLCDAKLTGIISVSKENLPAVFTKVSFFYDWIQNKTALENVETCFSVDVNSIPPNKEKDPAAPSRMDINYGWAQKETSKDILKQIIYELIYILVPVFARTDIKYKPFIYLFMKLCIKVELAF